MFPSLPPLILSLLFIHTSYYGVECKVYRGFNDIAMMPISVSDMTATLVEQSYFNDKLGPRVYVIGGCSGNQLCPPDEFCYCPEVTNSCNVFFIDKKSWASCPSAPNVRCRHSAAFLNGKIYLLGGRDQDDSLIQDVDVFDVASNQWTSSLTWNNASSDGGAFSHGDSIYLIGGYDADYIPLATLTRFSPETNVWNTLPPMTYPRGDLGAIAVPKDRKDTSKGYTYYVIGGFADDICSPLPVVETYDPDTVTWTTRVDLRLGRADMALGVLDGFLFTIAGETKDSDCNSSLYVPGTSIPVDDVERLDQVDGEWEFEENIPADRFRFVAASYKDAIYLFGGQGKIVTPETGTPYYHVLNTTMLYVPKSIADKRELNDGEIAGIVIACVIFVGSLVLFGLVYFGYQKYRGYTKTTEEEDGNTKGEPSKDIEVSFS
jgi:hypothetical protein